MHVIDGAARIEGARARAQKHALTYFIRARPFSTLPSQKTRIPWASAYCCGEGVPKVSSHYAQGALAEHDGNCSCGLMDKAPPS